MNPQPPTPVYPPYSHHPRLPLPPSPAHPLSPLIKQHLSLPAPRPCTRHAEHKNSHRVFIAPQLQHSHL